MRMLIATGVFPPQIGGPARYAKNIKEELVSRLVEAPVVTYSRLERSLPPLIRHAVFFFRAMPRAARADAILALDTWSVGLPALMLARLFGKGFLVRIGGDFLWEQFVERTKEPVKLSEFYTRRRGLTRKERLIEEGTRYLVRRADALLFTTAWQRDIWQRAYGFPSARAHVLENEYPPREAGIAASGKPFVFVGRRIRLKNAEMLERVFARLKERHPGIELDVRELPYAEHIERVRASYAVLVPSVSEVNPNTIIDAVRFGKPFLCTKDTGIYDRLAGTGLFVDTASETEVESGIEELLHPDRYEAIAERVRRFSYTHSWKQMVDEILSVAKGV